MKPRLLEKLSALRADPGCGHFILADAKDADMAWGATSCGPRVKPPDRSPSMGSVGQGGAYRSIADFRDQIREVVHQGLVDILQRRQAA